MALSDLNGKANITTHFIFYINAYDKQKLGRYISVPFAPHLGGPVPPVPHGSMPLITGLEIAENVRESWKEVLPANGG